MMRPKEFTVMAAKERARPLLEMAEGADQDDRARLLGAFRAVQESRPRREVTDIHVRELLTYVLAVDRDRRGVSMSYDEMARRLECERSTARAVVRRAVDVFGLLAVIEDRYTSGGQRCNRYTIEWAGVDAARGARPGVVRRQPPAARRQPPATRRQPYKEYNPNLVPNLNPTTTTGRNDRPGNSELRWVVVVRDLGVGMAEQAIAAATAAGLGDAEIGERVEQYRAAQATERGTHPGILYNWLAKRGSFEAWQRRGASGPPQLRLAKGLEPEAERRRAELIREGRRRGCTSEQIQRVVSEFERGHRVLNTTS